MRFQTGVIERSDHSRLGGHPCMVKAVRRARERHRRHLSESQRAMVAASLANMVVGGKETNSANLPNCSPVSQSDAAQLLQVSTRAVTTAAKVERSAPTEVVEAAKAGNISLNMAAQVANRLKCPVFFWTG